ncbi:hypothetical protein Tco_0602291 [Tanacetum coccineum]
MANMYFRDKHNMVAFLQNPTGSEEFHQIVDFLADSHIRYALTANPTIYVSLIEQFWQTVTVDTINDGEQHLTVIVDGQIIAITEASVRRHLQLVDADGISSLPNTEIFDRLTLMGYVSNNDKLTFQKGVHIPLFDTMLIHDQPSQGEGPTLTVESQHTPIASPPTSQPTTSQPMSSQEQPSQVPITEPITDSFTTSHPTQTPSPMPHDSPLSGGHTPGSDEGSKKLNELTELCTKLSDKVTSLEDDPNFIIRVRNITEAYQVFEGMLKGFDREDLVTLWSLVKERFRSAEPTEDKERALWVELKRLFEPNKDDVLWKLQRYMYDPLTWRLYDTCGVHHVSSIH